MDKELFRKTEGKLYRYYESKKHLFGLNEKITRLENHKETIEYDIRHTNIRIDPFQNGAGINERVQTSSNGTSYAEQEMIREIERLERERVKVVKQILKTKAKKRELENYISNMDFNINMLNEESKRFLELKYSDKAKVIAIAQKMNMAVATVYRIREEIVENVANFMNIIK
ncbi:transcriptional regulator [Clostridium tertium]